MWLRCADRVLIEIARFPAPDFEQLFETTKALDWTQWISKRSEFPVVGKTRHSQLTSLPAIQRSVKRAIVESLMRDHDTQTLPEDGPTCKVEIAILNDEATLTIDTTGPSLHKRGYRRLVGKAPLKETLASAMVMLSFWRPGKPLIDPFCGSGTIPIEAAMIGKNIAPGRKREFAAQMWDGFDSRLWASAREEAIAAEVDDFEEILIGTDIDAEDLSLARHHAEQAGVSHLIHFQQKPFDRLQSKREYGCTIMNPPYGERLENDRSIKQLYETMPQVLQRLPTWSHFILTSLFHFEFRVQKNADRRRKLYNGRIECTYYQFHGPKPPKKSDLEKRAGTEQSCESAADQIVEETLAQPALRPNKFAEIRPSKLKKKLTKQTADVASINSESAEPLAAETSREAIGVLPKPALVTAAQPKADRKKESFEIQSETEPESGSRTERETESKDQPKTEPEPELKPVFGGTSEKADQTAEIFANRLKKRAKHLRRWPTKRGITCFRLYEKDVPEVPLVVDRYEDHLHITEYGRPHDRNLGEHGAWLDQMIETASKSLGVHRDKIFFKRKNRQVSKTQHEKVSADSDSIVVNEGGLKFLVNLSDYVDTGLFLDHRVTRDRVRKEAQGKRVLNLFAYTGSFSVYAADGGAKSTTTVDWSNTYIDWARKNLFLNHFDDSSNFLVTRDVVDYIQELPVKRMFDLVIVDPPTFSNSKRKEEVWDVQRDYAMLLNQVISRVTIGGVIYFSTNFRRFKMDESELNQVKIVEISKQTVPEDFRNRRIHRCWRMEVLPDA